ncbi:hypothetical protein SBOR_4714 [Sclerotinia borealis F-4128]|uniref:DUF6590 domain-containing protein n=1 Tax=Sclerotinia borealis (strain F-4128) TaxID=1432307 RepID=W9CDU7_SCLBF|nr:hypothetical protein SBOR_4714 [Sclerotinia borealis F-4128]
MSSYTSRASHKYRRGSKRASSSFKVTSWSDWQLNTERQQWQSYRTNTLGETEWQYRDYKTASSASNVPNIPRFDDTVSNDKTQYSRNRNYSYVATDNNDVGALTGSLAAITLDSIAESDPPIVASLAQNNTSTEYKDFDPSQCFIVQRKIRFPPIRMVSINTRHTLNEASRINYTKLYTVEYNVKVWFIGNIDRNFESTVKISYDKANPRLSSSPETSSTIPYRAGVPTYSNTSYPMPGISSNVSGYPIASGYGNSMSRSSPSYDTRYNTGSGSTNSYEAYGSTKQIPSTQYYNPSSYPPSQISPPEYPPSHYPTSQYSTSQYPTYTPNTN